MRKTWLSIAILAISSQASWAIYGPSLARTKLSLEVLACREANFSRSAEIANAMGAGRPALILPVLGDALKEWRATPASASLYTARAFCVHELIPGRLPPGGPIATPAAWQPTTAVKQFQQLGLEYFYYSPDAEWTLKEDPVDLNQLAAEHLDSRWGRQAFFMMTQLGWSQGACGEGPDQFREVIGHSEKFLKQYPQSEVSNSIRLELANAYATWWNVSQMEPDAYTNPGTYKQGAENAKQRAIDLYQQYLKVHPARPEEVRKRLSALRENPKGSNTYDYLCEDYED